MKKAVRLVILGVAAAAVLATVILAVMYVRFGRSMPRKTEDGTPAAYTLGVWEGRLAVFEGEAAFPMKLYEVAVISLPQDEQQRLREGIAVNDLRELQLLLEDYTS